MARAVRLPVGPELPLVILARVAEDVVDALARIAYDVISTIPSLADAPENVRWALAYAAVGDLVASPLPPPLDAPVDSVVQERIRQYMPEIDRYRRMAARIAEAIPYLELLPTYTMTVMAAAREKGWL